MNNKTVKWPDYDISRNQPKWNSVENRLETDIEIGSIYETSNGNQYLKVSKTESVYLKNKDASKTDKSNYIKTVDTMVKVIGYTKL